MKKRIDRYPAPLSEGEIKAIKQFANDPNSRVAFNAIMKMTYLRDDTFVAGHADVSAFLQGKRSVGLQIVDVMNSVPKRKGE